MEEICQVGQRWEYSLFLLQQRGRTNLEWATELRRHAVIAARGEQELNTKLYLEQDWGSYMKNYCRILYD